MTGHASAGADDVNRAGASHAKALSALRRPPKKWIDKFTPAQAGEDTVGEYLQKGFSLIICCKACPRLIAWAPAELNRRFGDDPRTRISDIAERLSCKEEGGCGSEEVAVYPCFHGGE